jgi:glucose-fructose oxidoreductase
MTRTNGKRTGRNKTVRYDCILNDRNPESSGEEGLADVRIIEGMLRSTRSGRWVSVRVPSRKQRPTIRQVIRRPPVPREPRLIDAEPASQ